MKAVLFDLDDTLISEQEYVRSGYGAAAEALCREYPVVFGSRSSAAHRMKAIWHYLLFSFRDSGHFRKKLIKTRRWDDFLQVTEEIFDTLELLPQAKNVE